MSFALQFTNADLREIEDMERAARENVSHFALSCAWIVFNLPLFYKQWRDTLITDFQHYMFGIHNLANINRSFFQSNRNSPLPLETADDLFDDVSFPFMIN